MVLPGRERIPLPCPELPELVINAVNAIVVRLPADAANQRCLCGMLSRV